MIIYFKNQLLKSLQIDKPPSGKNFTSEYGISNYRADAPDTTTWHDIFDKRITGEIENDRYIKQVQNEYRAQELDAQKDQILKYMKHKKEIYGDDSEEASEEVSGFSDLDEEEKEFMEHLKQQRKEQQIIEASRKRYNQIVDIDAKSYTQAVKTDYWCLVFAWCQTQQLSIKINAFLELLNKQYPTIKICRIDYKQASQGFRQEDMPAIFVYSKGELITQIIGKYQFGGNGVKYEEFLEILAQLKIIQYKKQKESSEEES